MPSLKALRDQGRALVKKQQDLLADNSRPWSARSAEFERVDSDFQAVVKQIEAQEAVEGSLKSFGFEDAGGLNAAAVKSSVARGFGLEGRELTATPELSLSDDQLLDLQSAGLSRKSLRVESKAVDSSAAPMSLVPNYRIAPVTALREPQRVLGLFPAVATSRPVEVYYTTSGTSGAAAVAEGATKPTSTLSYTPVTVTVTKLAHIVKVTDETLKDIPSFVSVVQDDMVNGLIAAENSELLSATVTGAHKFAGLLNASGIQTRAKATEMYNLDVVEEAIDDLRVNAFTDPTAIVMHPTTWGVMRRTKDGNDRYLVNPDPTSATPLSLWGYPVIVTTKMPVGTALVANFRDGGFVFVRDGITIDVTNSNDDDFETNLTTLRAEERLALAVVRPTFFVKVTGLT